MRRDKFFSLIGEYEKKTTDELELILTASANAVFGDLKEDLPVFWQYFYKTVKSADGSDIAYLQKRIGHTLYPKQIKDAFIKSQEKTEEELLQKIESILCLKDGNTRLFTASFIASFCALKGKEIHKELLYKLLEKEEI